MSNFHQNYTNTWLAVLAEKRTLQFYHCTNFHATHKLAPGGTLRFAQSPLQGLAKKHNVCVYVCMSGIL